MYLSIEVKVHEGEFYYNAKHDKAEGKIEVSRLSLEQPHRLHNVFETLVLAALEKYDALPESEVEEEAE